MLDDIRPIARAVHFLLSASLGFSAAAVMWYILPDTTTWWKRLYASLLLGGACAYGLHYWLDWVIGVP
jgi:hypothetical protein